MEELDRELQRRVWERVQSREPAEPLRSQPDNLKSLMLSVQENSEAYRRLARQMRGQERERLLGLHRESRSCIACMKGICSLRRVPVTVPRLTPRQEPARRTLEKCYHRERKLCSEWERRASDPEHGVVFSRLGQQAREHCVIIMELLGQQVQ